MTVFRGVLVFVLLTMVAGRAGAQAGASRAPLGPIEMPPVIVEAQKEPADKQTLPVSVTVVSDRTIESSGIVSVREAAAFAPNTYYSDLSARKVSNARFRGVGSSPANPGVATYIDGVPQLNSNSSSYGLLDIGQIEFVRGPQSALFGRNALGGVVNVLSKKPSLTAWNGKATVPLANHGGRDVAGSLSGPLSDRLGLSVAATYGQRDGFSTNSVTGNTVDDRSAFDMKGQLLWTPSSLWETRLVLSGERARDGDYALSDLQALRTGDPFTVARDFEGRTDRDLFSTTFLARRAGSRVTLSTATGIVRWKTEDLTDLDYSPMPLATRQNLEEDLQFTQEVRAASAQASPLKLGDTTTMAWQTGVFLFTQGYDQNAVNSYSPFVLSPLVPFSVSQTTPKAALDDVGLGLFGHVTLTFRERLAVSGGGRFDQEWKDANLQTSYTPPIAPSTLIDTSKDFSAFSPQVGVSYRVGSNHMVYGSISEGFKAGGFNPAAPAGSESFDEEHAWTYEGGAKTAWANGRVLANVSAFYIDWQDLQLNEPDPFVPAQFFISNVGSATSKGVEAELVARPHRVLALFASAGATRGRFSDETSSMGRDVSGNPLPNTPRYTATLAAELAQGNLAGAELFARAEFVCFGSFKYDESNTVGQDAYSLVNLRGGLRRARLTVEAWAKNLGNTKYVPVAFVFGSPSGYLGEPGNPRTFGVTLGVGF